MEIVFSILHAILRGLLIGRDEGQLKSRAAIRQVEKRPVVHISCSGGWLRYTAVDKTHSEDKLSRGSTPYPQEAPFRGASQGTDRTQLFGLSVFHGSIWRSSSRARRLCLAQLDEVRIDFNP
ncbi:hypothetical protein SJ05684_c33680 [Sinorhizobium sojae CCBAU 05684]|uniref:Uncharacterized protein n=1 Tax=Sinorhizobium sojae CCBAU 05684 TaxID=716928 RepID=A0A249PFQ8_9HYPH|nr:hypothetical protein SJ05684_c33680 [Sinorhizobium sojae CCBAU 05684]